MPLTKTNIGSKRKDDQDGTLESDEQLTAAEFNTLPAVLDAAVDLVNLLDSHTSQQWRVGYQGVYTWTASGDGTVDHWQAAIGSTVEDRGTTFPGLNPAVWVRSGDGTDLDVLALFAAAVA